MRRDSKHLLQRCGRFDQHMQGQQAPVPGGVDLQQSLLHLGKRLHFGQHDIGQSVRSGAHNGAHVVCEVGMVYSMHAHADARGCRLRCVARQRKFVEEFGHRLCLLRLCPNGRAVLAVQRHVHHAMAYFSDQRRLQLQAFAHARRHAAVVVAHRQSRALGLRA